MKRIESAIRTSLPDFRRRYAYNKALALELRRKQDAARHDQAIAGVLAEVRTLYRGRLDRVGARLRTIGAVRASLGDSAVSDVLWFYFGLSAWRELREMGWPPGRIESWLAEQAGEAILGPASTN